MIQRIVKAIRAEFPTVATKIDGPPLNPDGVWWLDIDTGKVRINVEWSAKRGFGLHLAEGLHIAEAAGYGEKPDECFDDFDALWERLKPLLG